LLRLCSRLLKFAPSVLVGKTANATEPLPLALLVTSHE
jgi:hypothetical protein